MMDSNSSDYKDESSCDHHDNKPLLTNEVKPDNVAVSFKIYLFFNFLKLAYNKHIVSCKCT